MSDVPATTMQSKGHFYVQTWPANAAKRHNLSVEYVALALYRTGVIAEDRQGSIREELLRGVYLDEIANMTPAQAKAVVMELATIDRDLGISSLVDCRFCGLPLNGAGECDQCGEPLE